MDNVFMEIKQLPSEQFTFDNRDASLIPLDVFLSFKDTADFIKDKLIGVTQEPLYGGKHKAEGSDEYYYAVMLKTEKGEFWDTVHPQAIKILKSEAINTSLFQEVLYFDIPYSNHCSDLYLPVNPLVRYLINKYNFTTTTTTFKSQLPEDNGSMWYDVPFAYLLYFYFIHKRETNYKAKDNMPVVYDADYNACIKKSGIGSPCGVFVFKGTEAECLNYLETECVKCG